MSSRSGGRVREFVFTSESVAEGRPHNVAGDRARSPRRPRGHRPPDRPLSISWPTEQERYLLSWDEGT